MVLHVYSVKTMCTIDQKVVMVVFKRSTIESLFYYISAEEGDVAAFG